LLTGEQAAGSVVNTATVSAASTDPVPSNNTASATTAVEYPDRTPPQIACPDNLIREARPDGAERRWNFRSPPPMRPRP
jgi:hypothetical protein